LNNILILGIFALLLIVITPLASADSPNIGTPEFEIKKQARDMQKDISISTDKPEYTKGQDIKITFSSDTFYEGRWIEMKLTSPSGKIIETYALRIDSPDNQYQTFSTSYKDYFESGTYQVTAKYDNAKAETSFILNIPNVEIAKPPVRLNVPEPIYEGENPNDFADKKMIEQLQTENAALNSRLDSLTAVLNEQTKVLLDLSNQLNQLRGVLGEWISFDIFA